MFIIAIFFIEKIIHIISIKIITLPSMIIKYMYIIVEVDK